MPHVARWFVGYYRGRLNCTFNWPVINKQSVVLVSASEGAAPESTAAPERFVGAANVTVHNIAPFGFVDPYGGNPPGGGGVRFVLTVDWGEPLPIWADIVVLDEYPRGFSA
jgi:hypothetical protein